MADPFSRKFLPTGSPYKVHLLDASLICMVHSTLPLHHIPIHVQAVTLSARNPL